MSDENQPEYIPVDPQTFLDYTEAIEQWRGRTVSLELHNLLMVSIAQAIAAVESDGIQEDIPQYFLERVDKWLEHLAEEVVTGSPLESFRAEVQNLRVSTAHWQRHFREGAGDKIDTDSA